MHSGTAAPTGRRDFLLFFFFLFFFFLLLNACGIYFDVERCLLAFKDAMPCGPLWCDLTEDEKPKLRSWAPRAEHLKPNSHEREVQCTPVALLSPVRRCISMKCTGSLLQHGDAELQAAPDNAGDHSEMELIHADKRLGFMVRPKKWMKRGMACTLSRQHSDKVNKILWMSSSLPVHGWQRRT